jgi:hypothetical protein
MRNWKLFSLLHQVPKAASGAGSTFSGGNKLSPIHLVYSIKAVFCGGMKFEINPTKCHMLMELVCFYLYQQQANSVVGKSF